MNRTFIYNTVKLITVQNVKMYSDNGKMDNPETGYIEHKIQNEDKQINVRENGRGNPEWTI